MHCAVGGTRRIPVMTCIGCWKIVSYSRRYHGHIVRTDVRTHVQTDCPLEKGKRTNETVAEVVVVVVMVVMVVVVMVVVVVVPAERWQLQ